MSKRDNSGWAFALGAAIGTAIGFAVAYLSDDEKRNNLIDDVTDRTDRIRGDIEDAYYEGRIRTRKAKRDLSRYIADVRGDAEGLYEDVKDRARSLGKKAKDTAEDVVEYTKEELDNLKDAASEQMDKLAKEAKK